MAVSARKTVSEKLDKEKKSINALTLGVWAVRLVCAGILAQTLFFKFTGAPESVYIFTRVGAEPAGRIGSGIAELIAAVLVVIPAVSVYGAVIGLGVMSGAIVSHLTILGVEVLGDHGLLFALALIVWTGCAFLVMRDRKKLPWVGKHL